MDEIGVGKDGRGKLRGGEGVENEIGRQNEKRLFKKS